MAFCVMICRVMMCGELTVAHPHCSTVISVSDSQRSWESSWLYDWPNLAYDDSR